MSSVVSCVKNFLSMTALSVAIVASSALTWAQADGSDYSKVVYHQIARALAPQDAKLLEAVLPGSPESYRIDTIVLKILQTPTGSVLCKAFSSDPVIFHRSLFLNKDLSAQGYRTCSKYFVKEKQKHTKHLKKYFLIKTNQLNFLADGWTSPRNETFLFINKTEFAKDDARLTRTLAHELFMSYDGKNNISFIGHLNLSYNGMINDEQSTLLTYLLANTKLKNSLAAIRAFDFENLVAKELGFSEVKVLALLKSLNCKDKVDFVFEKMIPLSNLSSDEQLLNNLFANISQQNSDANNITMLTQQLSSLEINFSNGTTQKACEYLTESLPFLPGANFMGGPGPRTEGW